MSGSTVHNLLKGTDSAVEGSHEYEVAWYGMVTPLVEGKTYTISAYVDEVAAEPSKDGAKACIAVFDSGGWNSLGYLNGEVPGVQSFTFTYKPYPGHEGPDAVMLFNTPFVTGVERTASLHDVMLVEGNTPAAWAPADGETLAGGGCSHER